MQIHLNNNYQIRDFTINDVDSLVRYANDFDVYKYLRDSFPHPYTIQNAEQWLNSILENKSLLYFALANQDEVIGGIGAVPLDDVHRFSAEVGYWLGKYFWNKGIVSEALELFCDYLFHNHNFNRLTALVFEGNEASKKVLEKVGFKLEGHHRKSIFKVNKFIDHYTYALLQEEFHK